MTEDEEKKEKNTPHRYIAPPIDLLFDYGESVGVSAEESEMAQRAIVDTLSAFHIDVTVRRVVSGPTFTRYDIALPKSVDFSKIARYKREMAMALHTGGSLNLYPNYQEGFVSVEVPNSKRSIVGLKTILQAPAYQNAKSGSLMFAIGMDAEGKCIVEDLCKMPHMLVAGSTATGKSVFLHGMIMSLIMKYSPEELQLILIDPKWTEFSVYEGLPHLMTNEIITNPTRMIIVLNWAIAEMDHRYTLFAQMTQKGVAVRNIDEYNSAVEKKEDKLPKIVLIVDEVADLMATVKNDIEIRIGRIAAKARAAGIHLVLATQRPSVKVITSVLKANLPARVAFRVSAEVDSRVILDLSGAENLLGKGDLLYKTGSMYEAKRVQNAWIDTPEIQKICDFIREHNGSNYKNYNKEIIAYMDDEEKKFFKYDDDDDDNEQEERILKTSEVRELKDKGSDGIQSIIEDISNLFGFSSVEEKKYLSAYGQDVYYYVSVPQDISLETIGKFKAVLDNILKTEDINIDLIAKDGNYVIELKNCSPTSVTNNIMALRENKKRARQEQKETETIEPVYIDALRLVVKTGEASISMIQRKCSIGFNKAGKIVDWMDQNGYISPFDDGAKARKVLLTKEEFIEKFGEL